MRVHCLEYFDHSARGIIGMLVICKGLGGLALDSSPMVVEWKVAPIGLPPPPQQMMRA